MAPDKRAHRGPHPKDRELFAQNYWLALRQAVGDLSLLLSRDYSQKSALKLVGDRYRLTERQRLAVMRCACSDQSLARRLSHRCHTDQLSGQTIDVDGYNLLTTVEAGLAGGLLIVGRDGCLRDLASVHGTFRKVEETLPAMELIAQWTTAAQCGRVTWYLDQPVSNSGRLKVMLYEFASQLSLDWQVELVFSPDAILKNSTGVVVSSDSQILDQAQRWTNAASDIVNQFISDAWIVDLGSDV